MDLKSSIFVHWSESDLSKLSKVKSYFKRIRELISVNIDSIHNSKDYILPIVYVFIDSGTYETIKQERNGLNIQALFVQMEKEKTLIAELKKIIDRCRKTLIGGVPTNSRSKKYIAETYPHFIFIDLEKMAGLLDELKKVDSDLFTFLGGRGNIKFTYDAPKFIETVIRISRSNIQQQIFHEVIMRIDQDVTVFYKSIEMLLSKHRSMMTKNAFYYYSGDYGLYDKNGNPKDDHPVNNYAVRVPHLILPPNVVLPELEKFLQDLTELGAIQKSPTHIPANYSTNLQNLITHNRHNSVPKRNETQVISGACLIVSALVLRYIPPFMSFNTNVTWIDDHLKRRLLEALGFVLGTDLECLMDAKFVKNRHIDPIVIVKNNFEYAERDYFRILLAGCMFHDLVSDSTSTYVQKIQELIKNKGRGYTASLALEREIKTLLENKYEKMLVCWRSSEFNLAPPNDVLYQWANSKFRDTSFKNALVKELTEDAVNYLELISKWDTFVSAIDRL